MKTLAYKNGKDSIFLFEDNVIVKLYNDMTIVDFGNNNNLYIQECKDSNSIVYENVTPPSDWIPHRYFYDSSASPQWSINPDWIGPTSE
jgi:hypothetical protein